MLKRAHQEGYQHGLAAAQAELDEFREAAGQTAAAVLSAIESRLTLLPPPGRMNCAIWYALRWKQESGTN
jgi:hypothetical protein